MKIISMARVYGPLTALMLMGVSGCATTQTATEPVKSTPLIKDNAPNAATAEECASMMPIFLIKCYNAAQQFKEDPSYLGKLLTEITGEQQKLISLRDRIKDCEERKKKCGGKTVRDLKKQFDDERFVFQQGVRVFNKTMGLKDEEEYLRKRCSGQSNEASDFPPGPENADCRDLLKKLPSQYFHPDSSLLQPN